MPERMYTLNLYGGGADLVCNVDLREAMKDRRGEIVSEATVDPGEGDACGGCGWTPKPHVEVTL